MNQQVYTMPSREAPVLVRADIVVVGGGFPGVCAAVAAARLGTQVALIERDGMLGGQAAEVYTFGLDAVLDRNGRQFVRGIPWEIIQRTVAEGQSDPLWTAVDFQRAEREGLQAVMQERGLAAESVESAYLNPNAFRYVLQTMVEEEGITTLLESPLVGVMQEGNRVAGVMAQGGYGPFAVAGKVVVDTTPYAAVAALAGQPFPHPRVYAGTHPRVAGVDVSRLIQYLGDHPGDWELTYMGRTTADAAWLRQMVEGGCWLLVRGFREARERAIADDPAYRATGRGDPPTLVFFYDRDGCGSYWIHSDAWRHSRIDDPLHLSQTIAELRKRQWLTHKLFRGYVPGFERSQLVDVHPHIARSLVISREPGGFTDYDVPWEEIERGGNVYPDSVARIMGHPHAGQSPGGWQLPYRSLLPRGLEGLLVTGKPACRFIHYHGTVAAVGQAAGVAAAVAARDGVAPRQVDVAHVQAELERLGAVVF